MKKNDFTQVKEMDIKGLKEKAKDIKKEIANLYLDKNMNKLNDLKGLLKKRRDLSQVFTVLTQKVMLEKLEARVEKKGKK